MMQVRTMVAGLAGALVLWSAPALEAQEGVPLPQYPLSPTDRPVTPLMEGWYENPDGTYTISFGYINRNESDTVRIDAGEYNSVDPEEFGGMQPTTFLPGRHHGVFTVTLPGDRRNEDVWWSIHNTHELDTGDRTGPVHRIPGRAQAEPYELDMNPRPHGSIPPVIWFGSEERTGQGPHGVIAEETPSVSVGEPLTLEVHVENVSEWDIEDPGIQEEVMPVGVTWFEHRSPAPVTFERHPSTPEPEEEEDSGFGGPPGPNEVTLPEAEGTARVIATFSEPGQYLLRVRVDNFSAPDSSASDQCCWTNGYVRVDVTD